MIKSFLLGPVETKFAIAYGIAFWEIALGHLGIVVVGKNRK
jgi:ABC-type Co2+ transport system permease subunit